MGFLDNSGDIILDAVLTDLGRKRLAEGNGSFQISKFAFGDDEIDYGLYDKTNTNGSAYYDISILQTPVLEAFTNNLSSMKSRLVSYGTNDLLYLPVIMLSDNVATLASTIVDTRMVVVDQTTLTALYGGGGGQTLEQGLMDGFAPSQGTKYFEVDQGLNTTELANTANLDQSLIESQYYLQIDNRLGSIVAAAGVTSPNLVVIDDDNIATYLATDTSGVNLIDQALSVIRGPRGTRLSWKVQSSLDLQTSNFLFDQLGSQGVTAITNGSQTLLAADYKFIDSTIRVSGIATGFTLDIPIRFIKKIT
tara:strand:+ start:161 stop:1081 length:921 start_codon:yes stop_codon:yes gene_type:complete